jgi:CHASE2 domain-containing sensor protein
MHWLKGFETTAFDAAFHLSRPKEPKNIVLVEIDQPDYNERYRGTSPLESRALSSLLTKIEQSKPAIIAVDIDTSAPQFSQLPQLSSDMYVWAEGAAECSNGTMRAFGIAGRKHALESDGRKRTLPYSGIALSEQDYDGTIRRVPLNYPICSESATQQATPSFALAIAREYSLRNPAALTKRVQARLWEEKAEEEQYFGRYSFSRMSSRFVLPQNEPLQNGSVHSELAGKIVIVGGTYCEGNDLHRTAMGTTSGMEIVASQVAALIDPRGTVSRIRELYMILLDLVVGAILVCINHRFHSTPAKALLLSLLAIPVMALLASFLVFSSMAFWANTMPVSISVLIHQFYEHTTEYRRLYLESRNKSHVPIN